TDMDPTELIAELIEMLGLPETATPEDVMETVRNAIECADQDTAPAMAGARPDPAKYVPIEAFRDAMRDRNASKSTMSERQVTAKVEDALRRGYITHGMRDWATALCASDEASFDDFMAGTAPAWAHLTKVSHTAAAAPGSKALLSQQDPDVVSIAAQLGVSPDKLQG
ncbi:MAG: phage protease, partial [Jannaschia sp.]